MVTLATILVFIFLNGVIFTIDIMMFHYSFFEELGKLYYFNPLFGRIMLYFMIFLGFGSAIAIDIRIKKNKNKKQAT
ncbi:hypothetical protein [Bacillus benzoevorans]|uniref:Uncharacterized membrane protein (DUF106 family) n=1 Tax=Bacillus benzoevorans TaxID=1456 RepID=A0A7X0LX77_9BACI|nr:hypothetical protein [Bacillus benzoevorans]MBB6447325.1 uncharacterized membrane protein (DUF106 family) [Bacillus benzoevorans]